MESPLSKLIPALRKRDGSSETDTDRMPTEEEIEQAHREGKRYWFELTAAERNRYRRLQKHAERKSQRRGQRAYNRAQREQRIRRATVQAQVNVLKGPDTPMKANVLEALRRQQEASERGPRERNEVVPLSGFERTVNYVAQNRRDHVTPRQERRIRHKVRA